MIDEMNAKQNSNKHDDNPEPEWSKTAEVPQNAQKTVIYATCCSYTFL